MIRMAIIGAAVAAALGPASHAALADMAPHRAIYSLTLGKGSSSGRYVGLRGAVKTVLEKTCDAWIVAEEVNMYVDTQVGGRLTQDLRYTGWESLDGRQYRFVARSKTNDERKTFKGNARAHPESPGEAVYTMPRKMTMALPPGTHFYFGLTTWLIERAQAGVSRAETIVFDGTDDEGPQRATAFIIPLPEGGRKDDEAMGPLLERPGWSIRLAFYPVGGRAAAPDYEVQAVILDNGVTPRMELVFTGFTAIQKLEKIEALESPSC